MQTHLIRAGLLGTFLLAAAATTAGADATPVVGMTARTPRPILGVAARDVERAAHALFRLERPVSTRTARVGDPVHLRTASPIGIDGRSIPVGSYAQGVVTGARRPGRIRGRAELEIGLVSVTLPDGSVLPLMGISSPMEPPRRRFPVRRPYPDPSVMGPIVAGMVAGYGTATLVSRSSHSEDTIMRSGVVAGLATGVLVGVLKRGEDLVLPPGLTIDVVFEQTVR